MPTSVNSHAAPQHPILQEIHGEVSFPGDAGYEERCLGWNRITTHKPAVIIAAKTEGDVQRAVRYAAEHDLRLAVQATGHGMPKNVDHGVLLLTGNLNQVHVDVDSRTARIGGGAKWEDVFAKAQPHGLAGLSGSAPHVGVVGYTLGGGFSIMSRTYGLAVDKVRSVRLVTPEGDLIVANKDHHADLFWAVRGGGGAFGVITEIEIELVDQPTVYGGQLFFPADRAEEVITAYLNWTQQVPETANSSLAIMTFPPLPVVPEPLRGLSTVMVHACICAPEDEAIELLAPLRALGTMIDTCHSMPYSESGAIYQDPKDPLPAIGQGVLLGTLPTSVIPEFLKAFGPIPAAPNLRCEIRHLGGAIANAEPGSTAICTRRDAEYLIYLIGVPMVASPAQMDVHASEIFAVLEPYTLCQGPLNFIGEHKVSSQTVRALYGEATIERLRAVKRQYDPQNRFAFASLGILEHEEA